MKQLLVYKKEASRGWNFKVELWEPGAKNPIATLVNINEREESNITHCYEAGEFYLRILPRYTQRFWHVYVDTLMYEPLVDINSALENKASYIQECKNLARVYYFMPTQRVIPMDLFSPETNLAFEGNASSSDTYEGRDPQNVLKGMREGNAWLLRQQWGSIEIRWKKPVIGRYILLIGRTSRIGSDGWGKARICVNGNEICVLEHEFSSDCVCVIDLRSTEAISYFQANIDGRFHPGLAGIEIHPG